jgi:hypothetical protein
LKREVLGALAAIAILAGTAAADPGSGPRGPFDQNISYGGRDLVLRSASLKEVSFLKVNVYWVGLYLETVSTPADSILDSNQVKAFVFHFLRDVKSKELQEAWIQDLTLCCEFDCRPVIAQGRVLARSMPDVRSSQKVAYILFPNRVEVLVDGTALGTMVGASATRAIQATFLGPKAPLKLRKDLVGPRPSQIR